MMGHFWGDDWKHWGELYKAQNWINKFYWRATGYDMHSKEKYGTIRYEYEYLWIKNNKDALKFFEIMRRACHKFPNVGCELVTDVTNMIVCKDKLVSWYKGFFQGVCWGQSQSKWISSGKKFKNPVE